MAKMSTFQICRICLRTDYRLEELDEIILNFFKELCDNNSADSSVHFCCSICNHLLRKTFNFKKKCQNSSAVFQQWVNNNNQKKLLLSELYECIPTISSYGKVLFNYGNELQLTASDEDSDLKVKVEIHDNVDDDDDLLNEHGNTEEVTDDLIINEDTKDVAFGGIDSDISIDDKCFLDHIIDKGTFDSDTHLGNQDGSVEEQVPQTMVTSKENVQELKSKKGRQKNKKIKKEDIDGPQLIRPIQRRPLKDQKKYETVFNIQFFKNDTEAKKEFAERKTSERYLIAKYKCDICYTVYKCEKLMKFHKKWHESSAGEFVCDMCAMRFKRYKTLRSHMLEVHAGCYQCKLCPLITYRKMVMITHYKKHQGVSYTCKICERTFKNVATYMLHQRKAHQTEHVCVNCADNFVSVNGLMLHRSKVHNTASKTDPAGTAPCEPCGLTFSNQQVYTLHLIKSHKHKNIADTIIACPDCGLKFPDKMQVKAHRRSDHPEYKQSAINSAKYRAKRAEQETKCPLCDSSGLNNSWLYHHFRKQHPAEPYTPSADRRVAFLCQQCGKGFLNKTLLKEHEYSHSGLKPYRCQTCPAAFRTQTLLTLHLERHAPPKRECKQCGKKFASSANLYNHMRTHIGDRRFKCSVCSKGFLHSSALQEHVRGVHLHVRRKRKTNNIDKKI